MKNEWLSSVCDDIAELMKKEHRKDAEFRFAITASELTDIAKYITHDPNLNSEARPHGSSEDEKMAYGQLFVQAIALAQMRGIDTKEAINVALENWKAQDWKKQKAKKTDENVVEGLSAYPGNIVGEAFLDPYCKNLGNLDGKILVAKFIKPDHTIYFKNAKGIVTDDGGLTSHPAIIAREYEFPCVVGTGNATERIRNGQKIKIEADQSVGRVYLI
ncbi:MAG: hypothetical protein KKB25_01500 [Nanoarchaeota archaeon]|nr:hypothetical protein [Nanoarchaeota archaeon]